MFKITNDDAWLSDLCNRINQRNDKPWCVIACSGGGSLATSAMLCRPGSTHSILGCYLLQSKEMVDDFIGFRPKQYCCEQTARQMALSSYLIAKRHGGHCGIGVSCSLRTTEKKKGDHRFFLACQTHSFMYCMNFSLGEERARLVEENLVALNVLTCLEDAAKSFCPRLPIGNGSADKHSHRHTQLPGWSEIYDNKLFCGHFSIPKYDYKIMLPGSFNPVHTGHIELVKYLRSKGPVFLEMSVFNVDKPTLDYIEIVDRLNLIKRQDSNIECAVTNAATFVQKSELFPNTVFAVGVDTLRRIDSGSYYTSMFRDKSEDEAKQVALSIIRDNGCAFMAFGRKRLDGSFDCYVDGLTPKLKSITNIVSESDFRFDMSSTEIREANGV